MQDVSAVGLLSSRSIRVYIDESELYRIGFCKLKRSKARKCFTNFEMNKITRILMTKYLTSVCD